MAHTEKEQAQFILLRAKGFSFDKIAVEINVSKPTLIKWQVLFSDRIQNLEYFNFQTILEQYKLSKWERIKMFSKRLKEVLEEIDKKDLSQLPFRDLLLLKSDCEIKLEKEMKTIFLHSGLPETNEFNFHKEELVPFY